MAAYHCPQCQKELTRGNVPLWTRLTIGPLFGLPYRTLVCSDHGELPTDALTPEERDRIQGHRKTVAIAGAVVNVLLVYFIITQGFR